MKKIFRLYTRKSKQSKNHNYNIEHISLKTMPYAVFVRWCQKGFATNKFPELTLKSKVHLTIETNLKAMNTFFVFLTICTYLYVSTVK